MTRSALRRIANIDVYSLHTFSTEKPELMPLTFGKDILDEGQFAQLVCIITRGDEPLVISWFLKGDKVTSGPTLTTTSLGTRTAMLTISSVGYRHSGTYTCQARNAAGSATASAKLKVNGNLLQREGEE